MLLKKGSKGNLVLTMQKLLKSCGFNISCDGIFGSGTEKIVKLFQEDALIKPIDGIVGNVTYQALINAVKNITKNYNEKIIWLNPKDLKCSLVSSTSTSLLQKHKSFMNGAFFWYFANGDKKNHVIGWLYSEGKELNYSNSNKFRGTFLVLKDGTTIVKRMKDIELMEYKKKNQIWFCIQGFETFDGENMIIEGWDKDEVGRKCIRNIMAYNSTTGKVLIAFFNGNYNIAIQVAKKYKCDGSICLDAGGSSNLIISGAKIYSTSRTLNNIVYWN
jgi:hypothetical protein